MQELNVIIKNKKYKEELKEVLFGNEDVLFIQDGEKDIYDLLVELGSFTSKSQAKKNWNGIKEIPEGYIEIKNIGKLKRSLYIWKPT